MFIKGVGSTNYNVHEKKTHLLAYEAALDCLNDADMGMGKVDAVICSSLEWFYTGETQRHFASLLASTFKARIPIIRVPGACAGGGTALWTTLRMMNNSELNNVLVIGAEKLLGHTRNSEKITEEFSMAAESCWEQHEGMNFPAENALAAQAYLNKYPETTMDDLALISQKNHENAYLNPKAFFYGKKVGLDEIKNSPIVTSPLRLFDCSISVDGSAAVLLTKDKTDVKIAGSGYCADYLAPFERESLTSWEGVVTAANQAFSNAGIDRGSIDFAEVHDAFSIVELLAYEDLGFCKRGEAYKYIRDGYFKMNGKLPVNVSGGLKAKGHPVSATGLGMIYEMTKQMRKEAGDRQLSHINYSLSHNIGGAGGNTACHILKRVGG